MLGRLFSFHLRAMWWEQRALWHERRDLYHRRKVDQHQRWFRETGVPAAARLEQEMTDTRG